MRRLIAFALTLAFGFSALAVDSETWRDPKLGYRQKFTFTAATATCPQFPVAIVGNSTYFKIAKGRMKTGCWAVFDKDGYQWYGEEVSLSDDGTYHTFEFHASLSTFDLYTAKTALWLYYDPTNAPTSSQVGATGSANGKAVWGAYKAVWHFNETSGDCADSTGNGNTLTTTFVPTYSKTGQIGKCLLFDDANSQYLTYAGGCGISATNFTLSCWVKSDDTDIRQDVIASYNYGGDIAGYLCLMGATAGDPVHLRSYREALAASATTTGYSRDTWHHIAGTVSTNTSRDAYIDGGSKGSDSTDAQAGAPSLTEVGRSSTGNYLSGYVDEVRIAVAHSDGWITSEYASGAPGNGLTPDGSGEQTMPAGGNVPLNILDANTPFGPGWINTRKSR